MKKYPKAYEAVRAAIEKDVADGILEPSRLEPCVKITYGHVCRAIRLGLRSEDEVVRDYAIREEVAE